MIGVLVDYATPSSFHSERDRALLGLSANARRPVRFRARVKENVLPLRMALQTLGELIWSDDTWISKDDYRAAVLDPVITVHDDRLFFEAFSQDQSVYGLVIADRRMFEVEGEVQTGTTNVDFTAWLWAALREMRSSRDTWLRIESGGFEVVTQSSGGRYEAKVELPESWVRGFLQLQEAMAFPGTRVKVKPVDLLAAVRFLRLTKSKVSPRALRYEFPPGADARIVLEPWEKVVALRGATHNYDRERVIRTWGRRRLRLIEPLLPFADSVDIYLKGRALPSFYSVQLPGVTFVLGLSGFTGTTWTGSGSFDLLSGGAVDEARVAAAVPILEKAQVISALELGEALHVSTEEATRVLIRLCRRGRVMYDVEARKYRHRELFEVPIDEAKFHPPDERSEAAQLLIERKQVRVTTAAPRETKKLRHLKTPDGPIDREIIYRDWLVIGEVADRAPVEIVVNDVGRIIFGTCTCAFFEEHLLNQGPCVHMIALYAGSDEQRRDLPTSVEASPEAIAENARTSPWRDDDDGVAGDEADDESGEHDDRGEEES
jgi:hypothetical protein